MKEKLIQLLFGKILLVGLWISLIITLFGGLFYITQYGNEVPSYHLFHKKALSITSAHVWDDALRFSPYAIIQIGIYILVLTQLLRVALVTWYYFKMHDRKFVAFSLFILVVLIFSLFWTGD